MKKLIRDKIPEFIEDKSRLSQESDPKLITQYIAAKVLEEAQELSEAILSGNKEHITEEAADLYEVLYKVLSYVDKRFYTVASTMLDKRKLKGGFDDNWILEIDD
jgi:predicted house-cleaning noncanonical NTP pyrophosphatase (MazG superfamily)